MAAADRRLDPILLEDQGASRRSEPSAHRIDRDPITGQTRKNITFTRFDGTNGHVFSIRPNGSHEQQLTDQPGVQAHSSWAPNGRFLVYTQVNATGSSVERLQAGSRQPKRLSGSLSWSMVPHVSPDSQRVAFTSNNDGNYEIYSVNRHGSKLRQLTFSDAPVQTVGPKYSPDGKLLLFASDRDETDPANQQDLWTMPAAGGAPQRITQGLNNRESRSWSPDGRWIAFASNHQGNYDLYRIRPDGTGLQRILKTPEDELSVGWGPRR
jgi:TolB protein